MPVSLMRFVCLLIFIAAGAFSARSYSLFTHEQLIDMAWKSSIRPLLSARFPHATAADLDRAHAFAYGGCVIQDLGYYPFGKSLFSDLTHYVRSGDFIDSLLRNAKTPDEYAFALGALSHYLGDTIGHHDAINPATALAFPKLTRRFGSLITYDDSHHAHVRTEFGFDINQLSKHHLAPGAYLRHIGLRVSRPLLERAFRETYALELNEVLGFERRPSFRTYRWAVRSFLPRIAYAETVIHRDDFLDDQAGGDLDRYMRHLAEADFQTVWNQYRRKPGWKTYTVAFLLRIVPKIGPFSEAAIRIPTDETEALYIRSVNSTLDRFDQVLTKLKTGEPTSELIANRDLDTGRLSKPGEYPLTDSTYAKLLRKVAQLPKTAVPQQLRRDILSYYADPAAPISTKDNKNSWRRVEADKAKLQGAIGSP